MTSKFKCPVCQNNLHKINIVVSTCTNDKCKLWGSSIPNLVLESLTQAKQDLEIAKSTLKFYADRRHYKDEELDLSVYEWYEKEETGVLVLDDGGSIENGKKARDTLKQIADASKMIEHKE